VATLEPGKIALLQQAAVQAYLGFLQSAAPRLAEAPEQQVNVPRRETIETFLRLYPEYQPYRGHLLAQYAPSSGVQVPAEWWRTVNAGARPS